MNAYHQIVKLADHEYGNHLMARAAREAFARYPELEPMCVEVWEHGGWFLTYLRDGTVVGTANDSSTEHIPAALAFNGRCEGRTWKYLPTINRPNLVAMGA